MPVNINENSITYDFTVVKPGDSWVRDESLLRFFNSKALDVRFQVQNNGTPNFIFNNENHFTDINTLSYVHLKNEFYNQDLSLRSGKEYSIEDRLLVAFNNYIEKNYSSDDEDKTDTEYTSDLEDERKINEVTSQPETYQMTSENQVSEDKNDSKSIAEIMQLVGSKSNESDGYMIDVDNKEKSLESFFNDKKNISGDFKNLKIKLGDQEVANCSYNTKRNGIQYSHKFTISSLIESGKQGPQSKTIIVDTRDSINFDQKTLGKIDNLKKELDDKRVVGLRKIVSRTIDLKIGEDFSYGDKGGKKNESLAKRDNHIKNISITVEDGGAISKLRRQLGRTDNRDQFRFIVNTGKDHYVVTGNNFDEAKQRCIDSIKNPLATSVNCAIYEVNHPSLNAQVKSDIAHKENKSNSAELTHITTNSQKPNQP